MSIIHHLRLQCLKVVWPEFDINLQQTNGRKCHHHWTVLIWLKGPAVNCLPIAHRFEGQCHLSSKRASPLVASDVMFYKWSIPCVACTVFKVIVVRKWYGLGLAYDHNNFEELWNLVWLGFSFETNVLNVPYHLIRIRIRQTCRRCYVNYSDNYWTIDSLCQ